MRVRVNLYLSQYPATLTAKIVPLKCAKESTTKLLVCQLLIIVFLNELTYRYILYISIMNEISSWDVYSQLAMGEH